MVASRVRNGVVVVVVMLGVLSVVGAFGSGTGASLAYAAALALGALVVLAVATQHGRQSRAWQLVGMGLAIWAVTGCILVVELGAGFDGIPDLVVSVGYAVGYLPLMAGFAVLADTRVRVRRASAFIDGVLLFLVLYAVVWLVVVEPIAADPSLARVDRAFSALYPAGDLALVMLAVRVAVSRTQRHVVSAALVAGAVLSAIADVWLLVAYLHDPSGSYPVTDLLYLQGVAMMAAGAVCSLRPAPAPQQSAGRNWRWVSMTVAVAAVVPPLLLLVLATAGHRAVSVPAIAVWLVLTVATMVARNLAGVREVERAHQQATWLASHDLPTGMLQRSAFLREVDDGTLRERSGTIILVEVRGVRELADLHGYEASEWVLDTVAVRLRAAAGGNALLARMGHDQFVAFLRSADLAHGRQIAAAVQKTLREPVSFGDLQLPLLSAVGVAQADGAVIDVPAGVRRATEAMQHARSLGPDGLAFDADLTGMAGLLQAG
jgi:GGDEF domain-containing protein